jgi:hypothetical protein
MNSFIRSSGARPKGKGASITPQRCNIGRGPVTSCEWEVARQRGILRPRPLRRRELASPPRLDTVSVMEATAAVSVAVTLVHLFDAGQLVLAFYGMRNDRESEAQSAAGTVRLTAAN